MYVISYFHIAAKHNEISLHTIRVSHPPPRAQWGQPTIKPKHHLIEKTTPRVLNTKEHYIT